MNPSDDQTDADRDRIWGEGQWMHCDDCEGHHSTGYHRPPFIAERTDVFVEWDEGVSAFDPPPPIPDAWRSLIGRVPSIIPSSNDSDPI